LMEASLKVMDIVAVFGAGVIVSFTPCVYPVIPLVASSIAGANGGGGKLSAFVLSLAYVLGMAVVYSSFGVMAALTGQLFGHLQNTAAVFAVEAAVFFVFSLMMFDLLRWKGLAFAPSGAVVRPRNIWTVFLAGAVSGLVVGPCTAPVLSSILLYIGSKQNVLMGVFLMFVFSYGVGASLIIVGTFSGILGSLPKSGAWLLWIKRACGAVFLLAAAYFFYQFLYRVNG